MTLDDILDRFYPLPDASKQAIRDLVKDVRYPKGHILLTADKVERYIYFISKGMVRAYADTPNGQVTFWFGAEGDVALTMNSYIAGQTSYEDIELLEDCNLYRIDIKKLKQLYQQDIHLANWGRKFTERELVRTEERLIAMQFKTAEERYTDLINKNPDLLLRVQLGHIASYLGISQVSLSRIRAARR
ncbi:Crp/Fnr family transcriptional regulator [Mucilaginibacter conchicola]|uniref:Crp/Fnr family transcriptional regulator n=2 Tax=Mucilaginibacter conchicola TaxID=2303333 RepID=A0A372P240_9SPHI|nr:Crp/Fnr family transcriptional regulator [Mucilaginibacter conchicola]